MGFLVKICLCVYLMCDWCSLFMFILCIILMVTWWNIKNGLIDLILFKHSNNWFTPPPLSCLSNFNNWYQSQFLLFKGRSVSLNMTSYEGTSASKPPLFDGTIFSFWKIRMRTYLMALGVDVWDVVETGYTKPFVYPPRTIS